MATNGPTSSSGSYCVQPASWIRSRRTIARNGKNDSVSKTAARGQRDATMMRFAASATASVRRQ